MSYGGNNSILNSHLAFASKDVYAFKYTLWYFAFLCLCKKLIKERINGTLSQAKDKKELIFISSSPCA